MNTAYVAIKGNSPNIKPSTDFKLKYISCLSTEPTDKTSIYCNNITKEPDANLTSLH